MAGYIEEYGAYGRRDVMDSSFNMLSESSYFSDIGFTGREIDTLDQASRQHMHYRHRGYSPELGRFLQHVPPGVDPHDWNLNPFLPKNQYTDGLNGLYVMLTMMSGIDVIKSYYLAKQDGRMPCESE